MVTSGMTTFNLDIADIIEEAFEMVGKEVRGGYDLRTARRSLDLLTKEWANRGINLWTISEDAESIMSGTNLISLPPDTIDILEMVWRTGESNNAYDRPMVRMSFTEWTQMSNKQQPGTPNRFWVNRQTTVPTVVIWPVPTLPGIMTYWRLRRMEDAGDYTNTMDVPFRFLPAMAAGLAYYLAIKTPGADQRIPVLQAEYERQFRLASEEDRDRSSLFLTPKVC